jgi:sialic acid synthase SpsE
VNILVQSHLSKPVVIAEIGCNHRGEVQTAQDLIAVAKACGADIAKFQKRNPRELLTSEQYDAPYDNPHSYGRTYGEHREYLEFPLSVHQHLLEYCRRLNIEYMTSVWDVTSAREIASLSPASIKVPSACNNHFPMLRVLRDEFGGQVHLSCGMSKQDEIEQVAQLFSKCPERLVLYACTSGYPVEMQDVCLLELHRLKSAYLDMGRCAAIGFSGHHRGIAVDLGAAVLGARYVERHFTLDRTWKGTDHAASLEPAGLKNLVRDLGALSMAWSFKRHEVLPVEEVQRKKLRYRPQEVVESAPELILAGAR